MKLFVYLSFAYLAATASGSVISILSESLFPIPSGSDNKISFVSPNLARAIESKDTRFLETEIHALLDTIREILLNGLPEQGIPPFDPLEYLETTIDLDALGIPEATGFITFKNFVLTGLAGFEATHVKGSMVIAGGMGAKIEVTLLFENINLRSDYEADLHIFGINVFGKGDVKLDVKNLQFEVVLTARLEAPTTERIYLESMKCLPSVEDIHIEFTGLFNDPEQTQQVNDLLNSVFTNWVNEKAQDISDLIEKIVKYIMNTVEITTEAPSTTSEAPSITSEAPQPPINDCAEITTPMQNVSCIAVALLEGLQELIQTGGLEPLLLENFPINIENIGIGTGIWTFDKLLLSGYSKYILGKVESRLTSLPFLGAGIEITIPLTWDMIELDVTEHGEINIAGLIIKSENSKIMGFIRSLQLIVKLFVTKGTTIEIHLAINPILKPNDIKGICSGILLNNVDISDMLTNFANNELGIFLQKHGEDVGDIISAILMKIFDQIINTPSNLDAENQIQSDPIFNYILRRIDEIRSIVQRTHEYPDL